MGGSASGCAAGGSGVGTGEGVDGSGVKVEMGGSGIIEGGSGVRGSGAEPLDGDDCCPRTSSTSSSCRTTDMVQWWCGGAHRCV